jgi:hypothetical protein
VRQHKATRVLGPEYPLRFYDANGQLVKEGSFNYGPNPASLNHICNDVLLPAGLSTNKRDTRKESFAKPASLPALGPELRWRWCPTLPEPQLAPFAPPFFSDEM